MLGRTVITFIATSCLASAGLALAAPAVAGTVAADQLPGLLTVRADDTAHAYNRDLFPLWVDANNDGCDTRREVLIEESTTPVTVGTGCALSSGTWVSPYDNVTWTDPADVDIDHMVPLADAWRSGAWSWSTQQRTAYANDLAVPYALIAVTDNVNQAKGDKDPSLWLPPSTGFVCQYAIDWALVKYRWSLTADPAEATALHSLLSGTCGATPVQLPSVMVSTAAPASLVTPLPAGTTRLAGQDRYGTALAVSARYQPGVPAVFVATGANFPDALSAAAAAARLGGPLLLTPATALPAAVATELRRLSPGHIYLVGGTGVVTAGVGTALAAIAPTTRLSGSDRYATGLAIAKAAFPSTTDAFIATGRNFPDALAQTGAAGLEHAPVILVDGAQRTVPAATLAVLSALGVSRITIAGGTGAVSSGIATQLSSLGYTVTRFGGASRYDTAALINAAFFPAGSTDTMFLATGLNFPDALAGAALAGQMGAPLFVTSPTCAPTPIHLAVQALSPAKTVVLGGTGVVGSAAANNTECAAPAPPPTPTPTPPANPGDSKNCTDFTTWSAAQAWFDYYFPYYGDVARLDADHDGIACESLPGAP